MSRSKGYGSNETRTGTTSQGKRKQNGQPVRQSGLLAIITTAGDSNGLCVPLGTGGRDRGGASAAIPDAQTGGIVSQLIDDLLQQRSLRLAEIELIDNRIKDLQQLQAVLEPEK